MPNVAPVFLDDSDREVSSIAGTGPDPLEGTPWEELAARIPAGASVPQILEVADLDWEVAKLPVFTEVVVESGILKAKVRIDVPGSYTCVRLDNHQIISPFLGKSYKVVQNEDAFLAFERFCLAGGLTLETAGALSGGRHIWGMASIGEGYELSPGEYIKGYFLLMQSHFYGHSLKAMFTPVRYPGGHTLVKAINVRNKKGYYTMPHSRHFNEDRRLEIDELVERAQESLKKFVRSAEFLANCGFTEKDGAYFLASIYNPKMVQKLKDDDEPMPRTLGDLYEHKDAGRAVRRVIRDMDPEAMALPSCNNTAWGYYNIVADDVDKGGRTASTSLESAWMGKGVNTKVAALNKATLMAASKSSKGD